MSRLLWWIVSRLLGGGLTMSEERYQEVKAVIREDGEEATRS